MAEIRNCKDCGRPFTLEPGEIKFFMDHRLKLPVRCKPCRKAKSKNMVEPNFDT